MHASHPKSTTRQPLCRQVALSTGTWGTYIRCPLRWCPVPVIFSKSPFPPPYSIKQEWFSFFRNNCRACSFVQRYGKCDFHRPPRRSHWQCTFFFSCPIIIQHHKLPSRQPSPQPFGQEILGPDMFRSISRFLFNLNFLYCYDWFEVFVRIPTPSSSSFIFC